MRLGLAANRLHHQNEEGALFTWLHYCETGVSELALQLHTVGRTYDAIASSSKLQGYSGLQRYPFGHQGGLMQLVAEVVGMGTPERTLDGIVYLMDPVDPSSIFPEALALKRQCVIHGKPFLSTVASARDWMEMERIHAGLTPDPQADVFHDYAQQTLALIAHDAMKPTMMDFVARNFDLLSRFGSRVGTGTTGQQLNELAWSKGWPKDQVWVQRYNSGPLGGDAQIAALVLNNQCHRAIFFEDPHVARQHEADIQLLERAVTTATYTAVCTTAPNIAQRWCDAAVIRGKHRK
ncbi:methylglyoxal synthase [Lampropedia puyangensis]|uniref:Methylglyoxal synthase n=1 Tax=Lampropedia puyangensis TaxID=1330072 RepID=A0A4S8EVC7_9BURK|nr:methylglyoxal synthase [Lampropedia puyangensis]THT98722.1 methylglyoxal synthase [Lampropedia puyangensis]